MYDRFRDVGCVLSWCFVLFGLGVVTASAYRDATKVDTAEDVMKSCADTGMYLHKGYAISCRVLIDGSFEPKGVKI